MKVKENVLLFAAAGFVFFVAYLLFGGLSLEHEIQFIPEWTISLEDKLLSYVHDNGSEEYESGSVPESALPFKLAQFLGYITETGSVPFIRSFPEKASLSQSYWTSYISSASQTPVYSTGTGEKIIIEESGFPYISNNNIYVFYPGGNSFGKYSGEGKKLWSAEHWSPITAFASCAAGTVCGYADGDLRYFDDSGRLVFSMYPGGSTYEIILGATISEDGAYIAAVCGLEKQRFIVIQVNGKNSKIIYHTYLQTEKTAQTLVYFNKQGSRVYFNFDGGLGIVDFQKNTMVSIPVSGDVCSISECGELGLYFVLCQDEGQWTVLALESYENLLGSFSFTASAAFMTASDNSLYLGKDSQISKLEIVRK